MGSGASSTAYTLTYELKLHFLSFNNVRPLADWQTFPSLGKISNIADLDLHPRVGLISMGLLNMMIPILLEFKFLKNFKEILHTCLLACMYVYCVYG